MNIILISISTFLILVLIVWWKLLSSEVKKDLKECNLN